MELPENATSLEAPTRLSRSVLWDLSRGFYLLKGPRAWAESLIPSAVSTHPGEARAYAHLVVAFLRDCARSGVPLDPTAPLYIVELGTGPCRFGYRLARWLRSLEPHLEGLPRPMVVATDLAEGNLEFVQSHPLNQPLFDERRLDVARFDAESDRTLSLRVSGATIGPERTVNPLIVVANYLFDSLRADAWRFGEDGVFEARVAAFQEGGEAPDPSRLEGFGVVHTERPAEGPQYPDDPLLDSLLDEYREAIDEGGVFLPLGPLAAVRNLHGLSAGPTLLLVGDKMFRYPFEMRGQRVAGLVKHGSFSITVNGHALQREAERLGGFALHASSPDTVYTHSAFVLGAQGASLPDTRLAFQAHIEDFGPREAHRLSWELSRTRAHAPDPDEAIQRIRMAHYDPWIFRDHFPVIFEALTERRYIYFAELNHLLDRVAAQVYPLRPGEGICLPVARGYQAVGRVREAIRWFANARVFDGPSGELYEFLGLALEQVDPDEAVDAYRQALVLEPGRRFARERITALEAASDG